MVYGFMNSPVQKLRPPDDRSFRKKVELNLTRFSHVLECLAVEVNGVGPHLQQAKCWMIPANTYLMVYTLLCLSAVKVASVQKCIFTFESAKKKILFLFVYFLEVQLKFNSVFLIFGVREFL